MGHARGLLRALHNSGTLPCIRSYIGGEHGPISADGEEPAARAQDKSIADLDVDEFLSGDFLSEASGSDVEEESEEEDVDALSDGSEDEEAVEGAAAEGEAPSSEDEEEGGDVSGVAQSTRKLRNEVASHKAQLEALKEQDPEFYQYLQEADQGLLAFGSDEEEAEEEEEDEEEEEEDEDEGEDEDEDGEGDSKAAGKATRVLLLVEVESWSKQALATGSVSSVRHLCRAYRSASRFGNDIADAAGLQMGSSAVYNHTMLFMLREADGLFRRVLGVPADAAPDARLRPAALVKLAAWSKASPLIKSYLGNTLHLCSFLTDPGMLAFILRRLRASAYLLCAFPKLERLALKAAFALFPSENAPLRVQAVLLVRALALAAAAAAEASAPGSAAATHAGESLDGCLRGAIKTFSANASKVNVASRPILDFMGAATEELFAAAPPAAGYRHAYEGIRQLAAKLRAAMDTKTKDAYREVYSWQFVSCLELWTRVVAGATVRARSGAAASSGAGLEALAYPLSQVLLGTSTLLPTPGYFPLRLRCARALSALGAATGLFVPAAPVLLEVLAWPELT